MEKVVHPWQELASNLKELGYTQRFFAKLIGKSVSELNELLKGKRNITVLWDLVLSRALWTAEKYWLYKQLDYDYAHYLLQHPWEEKKVLEDVTWVTAVEKEWAQENLAENIQEKKLTPSAVSDQQNPSPSRQKEQGEYQKKFQDFSNF